jgi:hypothetical protein
MGFGPDTIKSFDAAATTTDVANLSSLFAIFADAQGATKTSGASTIITDAHDTLTFVGVEPSALIEARLGVG